MSKRLCINIYRCIGKLKRWVDEFCICFMVKGVLCYGVSGVCNKTLVLEEAKFLRVIQLF